MAKAMDMAPLVSPKVVDVATPNFNSRRGQKIRLIVLHCDASPDSAATRAWIQSPASQVSYHIEIERDGTLVRYVADENRAWAVGVSDWRGITDVNSISLSASFANRNDGKERLTDVQLAVMHEVITDWRTRYPTIEAIDTHAALARPIGRKTDPIGAPNFRLADFQ